MTLVDIFAYLEARSLRLKRENAAYTEPKEVIKQNGEYAVEDFLQSMGLSASSFGGMVDSVPELMA